MRGRDRLAQARDRLTQRMFGIRTAEKLSAVFPGAPTPANDEAPTTTTTAGRDDLGEDKRDDSHWRYYRFLRPG